eukprot:TCONS_00016714-protein
MSSDERLTFLPSGVDDVKPIELDHTYTLGDVPGYMQTIMPQGFDASGTRYLFYQDRHFAKKAKCECCEDLLENEIKIYVISYNKALMALEKNVLKMFSRSLMDDSRRMIELDTVNGNLVHATITCISKEKEEIPLTIDSDNSKEDEEDDDETPDELQIDLYYFHIMEHLNVKGTKVLVEDRQEPDLTLKHDGEEYTDVKLKYNYRFGDETVLLVIAYNRDEDENYKPIFDTEICIDIVHTEKGKIWHSERVKLDLSMTKMEDHGIPEIELTRDRIYVCDGKPRFDILPNVYEFDLKGNLMYSYEIAPDSFDAAALQRLDDHSMSIVLTSYLGEVRQLKLNEGDTIVLKDVGKYVSNLPGLRKHQERDQYSHDQHSELIEKLGRLFLRLSGTFKDSGGIKYLDVDNKRISNDIDVGTQEHWCRQITLNQNAEEVGLFWETGKAIFVYMEGYEDKVLSFHVQRLKYRGGDNDINADNDNTGST